MLIRIILLLLPLILYIFWLWRATHQIKKGKRKEPIPKSWQRNMLILVALTSAALFYLGYTLTESQDETFSPFRPQEYIEQETTR